MTALDPEFAALLSDAGNSSASGAKPLKMAADPSKGGLPLNIAGFDTGLTMPEGLSRVLAGAGQGMYDLARHAGNLVGLESDQDLRDAKAMDAPLLNTTGGKVGNFIGTTAALAPLGMGTTALLGRLGGLGATLGKSAIASGAIGGATQGALMADPGERLAGAGVGALAGGLLPGIGGAGLKMVRGIARTPAAQALLDRGIDLTGGQMNPKGILNRFEQAAEGALGVGDVISNARENAMRQYSRAMVEDAMAPGSKLASQSHDFNDLINEAGQSFGPAYDLAKGFPVGAKIMRTTANVPLRDAIADVVAKPRLGLADADRQSWGKQLNDQLNQLIRTGRANGGLKSDDLIAFRSNIRDAIRGEAGDTNASRALKSMLSDVNDRVTQAIESQLPKDAAQALRDADAQYARFAIVRNAAKSAGDRPGGPTPFEMSRAISNGTDGNTYASGGGLGRELSKAARETFQSNVPRTGLSGFGRLLPFLAAGAGALHHPAILAPLGALGALDLTQTGRRALAGNTAAQKAVQQGLLSLSQSLPAGVKAALPAALNYGQSGLLTAMVPRIQQMQPSQ